MYYSFKIYSKTALFLSLLVFFYSCENNVEEEVVPNVPVNETEAPKETPSNVPINLPGDTPPETPKEVPTDQPVDTPVVTPKPSVISFSAEIKPIFDSRCVRCHGGGRFPDMRSLSVIQENSAIIKSAIVNRRMPQGGSLPNNQITLIRDWIDSGALNN